MKGNKKPKYNSENYFYFLIPKDLKKQAQQHAEDTGRTLAGLIRISLKEKIKRESVNA